MMTTPHPQNPDEVGWHHLVEETEIGHFWLNIKDLERHPDQRPVYEPHVKNLYDILERNDGMRNSSPLIVSLSWEIGSDEKPKDGWIPPQNKKFRIIDGHHRWLAALQMMKNMSSEVDPKEEPSMKEDDLALWRCRVHKKGERRSVT
jgi:hypothetical protein